MKKNSFTYKDTATIHMRRNKFDLSHRQLSTCTVGRLQPFLVQEVYPGDTFKIDETTITKVSSAFIKPPMGNLFFETYYFFVPHRLTFKDFENVVGLEADPDAWDSPSETTVPMISAGQIGVKSVADFMRLPIVSSGQVPAVSVLPFRAFAKVYDYWFRNQNVIDKMNVQSGALSGENLNINPWSPSNYTGMCPSVGKYKDIFTTALPKPQKGDDVQIPIGIPQTYLDTANDANQFSSGVPLYMNAPGDVLPNYEGSNTAFLFGWNVNNTSFPKVDTMSSSLSGLEVVGDGISGTNLILPAVESGSFTINDLLTATAMQRELARIARVGSRYQEILAGIWGVDSPDARLQRPEYLAGKRTLIQFQQVAQTSSSTSDSYQANLTAYSNTMNKNYVAKSFVEHGYIIGVCCIRQQHVYQDNVERFWTRNSRTEFYSPSFAHLPEVPVYQSEIKYTGFANTATVFGFQEAWYDLRHRAGAITGEMRSEANNTLDIWHFGDEYTNAPVLSKEFIEETPNFVDRTLAVPSSSQDQFILDTWFEIEAIRRLPVHSIPSFVGSY